MNRICFLFLALVFSQIPNNIVQAQSCSGSIKVWEGNCLRISFNEPSGYNCAARLDAACGDDSCQFNVRTRAIYKAPGSATSSVVTLNHTYFCDPSGGDTGCNGLTANVFGKSVGNVPTGAGSLEVCVVQTSDSDDSGSCVDGTTCDKAGAILRLQMTGTPAPTPRATATAVVTQTPTFTPTPIVTVAPTSSPTIAPSPSASVPADIKVVSDAGGPYIGAGNLLLCSEAPVSIQLDGSKSSAASRPLQYKWTSDCPSGKFDDDTKVNPQFSLITAASAGRPLSCNLSLTVTESQSGKQAVANAAVVGQVCKLDCLGKVDGTAVLDGCGVCNGNGSSCVGCTSENVVNTQLLLDSNAAVIRNNLLIASKYISKFINSQKSVNKQLESLSGKLPEFGINAEAGYVKIWGLVYTTIPGVLLSCQAKTNCVNYSIESSKFTIADEMLKLSKLGVSLEKEFKKVLRAKLKEKTFKRTLRNIQKLNSRNLKIVNKDKELLSSIPSETASCK